MGLLNKLTIKNLKLNKKRTIVTIIGIILSVALITAVSTMYFSLVKTLVNFEKDVNGDFHAAIYDVKSDDIGTIKNNRNVESFVLTSDVGTAKIDSKNEYKPYAYVKEFSSDALETLAINLVDGRLPKNSSEILIPSHLEYNGRVNYKIGDVIKLSMGSRFLDGVLLSNFDAYQELEEFKLNGEVREYTVVGIIERPSSNIESYDSAGYSFITTGDLKDSTNYNIFVRYTKKALKKYPSATASIIGVDSKILSDYYNDKLTSEEDLNKYFEEMKNAKYKYIINQYIICFEANPLESNIVDGFDKVIYIVCLIIVVTSIFCIKNSFDISITEKIKQYGMLRSVGATKKQIKKNVFYEATILGLFGIPIGILCGIFASYILIIVSNNLLRDMLTEHLCLVLNISIYPILLAIILGIITIYLSAFRSASKASKVSPIENIRNSAKIKINRKKLKCPKVISKLFGIGGEISYKNLRRNKKKYRTTVISIIVSVSIFIALSYFMNLAFSTLNEEIKIKTYNVSISLDMKDDTIKAKVDETLRVNGIKNYSVARVTSGEVKDLLYSPRLVDLDYTDRNEEKYITVIAVGDYQYRKYIESLNLKYDDIKDKGILVDNVNFYINNGDKNIHYQDRLYKNKIGDKITLNDKKIEIGALADKLPFGLENNSDTAIIVSDAMYDSISSDTYVNVYYKTADSTKLLKEVENIMGDTSYSSYNLDENIKMMKNFYTLIGIFLYGFIIVISLIGITNIFNTITTNMELRKTEFAMLKSIGMTSPEFKHMIRLESIFMGVKSLIFGIPIGIGLSYLLFKALNDDTGFKLPVLAIVISILIVFLLISLIMRYSIKKQSKQNTIETIRSENI